MSLQDSLQDAFEATLYRALNAMPPSMCSGFGAALSPVLPYVERNAHRHAKKLFATLRPEWAADPAALAAAVRRLWSSVARTYAEFGASRRLVERGHVTIEHVERLEWALACGRPMILTFIHTGNWEVSGMDLAFRFAPRRAFAIYDPPKKQSREALAMQVREQMPVDFIAMSPLVWRHALARLRKPDGVLWISIDDFSHGIVGAPFLGRPIRFDSNIGKIVRLAMRTNAVIVPFFSERHPGPRFTTHILEPLSIPGAADDDWAVFAGVKALDEAVTAPLIAHIDQWYYALMYRDYASLIPDDPAKRAAAGSAAS